jgi:hypothetical protein
MSLPFGSPYRDSMRTRWSRRDSRIEIELELGIKNQIIRHHLGDVNLVVALCVHFAEIVFV